MPDRLELFRDSDQPAPPPPAFGERSPSPSKLREDWRDYLVPQDWGHFTHEDHHVWDTLFARQVPYLGSRIVTPFLKGIPRLGLDQAGIPDLDRLNERLEKLTGWRCVSVAVRATLDRIRTTPLSPTPMDERVANLCQIKPDVNF